MDSNNVNSYSFLPALFLRAPAYTFTGYELSRLPEVLQQQDFQNAIWLASPGLYKALASKHFDYRLLNEREEFAVSKYYNRLCFRPTPFGSFASFTMLQWGDGDPVLMAAPQHAKIHIMPDQEALDRMNAARECDIPGEMLMVSPCLYRLEKEFRYINASTPEGKPFDFRLKALDAVKFHVAIFNLFEAGPVSAEKILTWIEQHGSCSAKEAKDYIGYLLQEQVLIDTHQRKLIYDQLEEHNKLDTMLAKEFWSTPRRASLDYSVNLPSIGDSLRNSGVAVPAVNKTAQPFYAALERPLKSGGPGIKDQSEINLAVKLLRKLAIPKQPVDLTQFIRGFQQRFDRQKVPLLLALDPDAGVPYGNIDLSLNPPVLENVKSVSDSAQDKTVGWDTVHRLLFRLWIGDQLRDPWSPLEIRDEDIPGDVVRNKSAVAFPQTMAVLYRRTAENLIIEYLSGVSATTLTGRFSCFSKDAHQLCLDLAAIEVAANPDVVFADIHHSSDAHVDNINRRMQIYPYEIPVNVYGSLPVEQQLRLDDLVVSVRGSELILESLKLGKRVIPRLATAYNFRNSHLNIFRLLCDLQFQGLSAALAVELEQLFPGLDFYPRVSYRNTILSLAKWNLNDEQITYLTGLSLEELLTAFQKFRQLLHIPRHISLGDYDQQLVFDLADQYEVSFFIKCISELKKATIREYLLPDRSVRSENEAYAGQMVAFLSHSDKIYRPVEERQHHITAELARDFMAGTKWLYLKIYCTPRVADAILCEVVRPFVAVNRNLIDKWFFIRYDDRGNHLRLRIKSAEDHLGTLLVSLQKRMESGGFDKLIQDYQLDTYRQEVERYGMRLMPLVENVFCAGSLLTTWFLRQKVLGNNWEEFGWGIVCADQMIQCFLPQPGNRLDFIRQVSGQFFIEFGAGKSLKTEMDLKYRLLKPAIETALRNTIFLRKLAPLIKSLKAIIRAMNSEPGAKPNLLLADLVHMQMNRTFQAEQRKQEFLIYYCLEKYTIATLARQRK